MIYSYICTRNKKIKELLPQTMEHGVYIYSWWVCDNYYYFTFRFVFIAKQNEKLFYNYCEVPMVFLQYSYYCLLIFTLAFEAC